MSDSYGGENGVRGKNGITIVDAGECWRALSGVDIADPQILDYQSRDGRKTGIKYALGTDSLTGKMRIAFIDYPKDKFELDSLLDDDEVVHILTHCNVCSAVEQVVNRPQPRASRVGTSDLTRVESSPGSSPRAPSRVSAGDVFSSPRLPGYLSAGITLGKSLGLRPAGNALVTLGLSVLSDLASGVTADPKLRSALQAFSDDMADTITPELVGEVREDAVRIAEAMERDHTSLMSKDFIRRNLFKSPSDIKRELSSRPDTDKPNSQPYHPRPLPSQPVYSPDVIHPMRIWGE